MIRQDLLSLPGGTVVFHNNETKDYLLHIAAKMLFPKKDKDKGKRNRVLIHWGALSSDKSIDSQSIMEEAFKEQVKGCVAGEAFMLQSLLSFEWEIAPSIRLLEYAVKQGLILKEHETLGYPVKQLRPIYNKYGSVKHLWCADSFMKWKFSGEYTPSRTFTFSNLFVSPGYFLGLAEAFRLRAKEAGLVSKKNELWMPAKWQNEAESFELKELSIGITEDLDKRWRGLGKLWEWYKEGKKWQHMPKKS